MATPVLRAGSAIIGSGASKATSLSLVLPSGAAAGDTLLAYVVSSVTNTYTSGSGATAFAAQAVTGAEPFGTLLAHTWSAGNTEGWAAGSTSLAFAGSNAMCVACLLAVGSNPSFDPALSGSGQSNTASLNIAAASVTTTNASDLLVWFGCNGTASAGTPGTITVPTSPAFTAGVAMTKTSSGSFVNVGLIFGTATAGAAGATGTITGTDGTSQASTGLVVSLAAPAAAYFPPRRIVGQAVNRAATYFRRVPWHERPGGLLLPSDAERRLVVAGG